MVNLIWALLAIIGIVYAAFNGTMEAVNKAIFSTLDEAVMIALSLAGVLIFWLGLMKIAEEAGLLRGLAKLFKPFVRKVFPDIPENDPALGYILSNMTANIFGLGNAATPMGLKAMNELKRLSDSQEASRSMITLLAINTSSLTLIPTTVIAIRMKYGSEDPTSIVGATILATIISTCAALLIDRYFYYRRKRLMRT
ncbi:MULTISPECIES: nucleoside recognition domain-containing protein [Halobacillus]|uniref:Spore maturation protein A n=1 Tax=Halobacillus halophilus (strain ATCC 35676 / DSM 2266 / JCM 20832 / KCTC 3685 / LMG 17431 / NBRC 102448 / NCIMB 2269) TaxID=866895 RepID=I0JNG0_HALH3|nr:nucleoside recognition domain-containing protein [Halobacillus halophilus]ASF39740.1 spore maturation protein [Halobacillus halophilus]CCG45680.1 spore maturation protein A [Halobacillus halophilus DSM 2266]